MILGRELDLIAVKGRSAPLKIFELLGIDSDSVDGMAREFLGVYSEGISLYRMRRWKEATKKFEQALHLKTDDYPSQLYIGRSAHYVTNPPPASWDGVFVMQTK